MRKENGNSVSVAKNKGDHFIGVEFKTPKGGVLRVIGISNERSGRNALYLCECSICSKDKELYPEPFKIKKNHLISNHFPCGCTKSGKYTKEQHLIIIRRLLGDRATIIGMAGEYKGLSSKISCECNIDGFKWKTSIASIKSGSGCPMCVGKARLSDEDLAADIKSKCKPNHTFLGFVDGFKNKNTSKLKFSCALHGEFITTYFSFVKSDLGCCPHCKRLAISSKNRKDTDVINKEIFSRCLNTPYKFIGFVEEYNGKDSKLIFECPEHGKQIMSYHNFIYHQQGCPCCALDSKSRSLDTDRFDTLYLLNINDEYIKVGRTFNIKSRLSAIKRDSKIKNIKTINTISDTHENVFKLEKYLHSKLREGGYWNNVEWSVECFYNESIPKIYEHILEFYGGTNE